MQEITESSVAGICLFFFLSVKCTFPTGFFFSYVLTPSMHLRACIRYLGCNYSCKKKQTNWDELNRDELNVYSPGKHFTQKFLYLHAEWAKTRNLNGGNFTFKLEKWQDLCLEIEKPYICNEMRHICKVGVVKTNRDELNIYSPGKRTLA